MLNQKSTVKNPHRTVYSEGLAVIEGLQANLAPNKPDDMMSSDFAYLAEIIEVLPLTVDCADLCFLRNWVASSRMLWRTGEIGAARYQLKQIGRVLNRLHAMDE